MLEAEEFKIKVLTGTVLGEGSLPDLQMAATLVGKERGT
jgi:hypothetical protein